MTLFRQLAAAIALGDRVGEFVARRDLAILLHQLAAAIALGDRAGEIVLRARLMRALS
jgi:hypothetical protein